MRQFTLTAVISLFGLAPALGQTEVTFDAGHTDVVPRNGRWQLVADGQTIKDLGTNEGDAREALRLVRAFSLTQYGVIGTPNPVLEYWLSDGHAPRGFAGRLQRMTFDAASLRVEAWEGQWYLRDTRQALFVFGHHEADARRALAVVQRHGFNQIAYVGRSRPVMMFFLNDPNQPGAPAPPAPPIPSGLTEDWHAKKSGNAPMPPGMMGVRQLNGANPLQMATAPMGDWRPIDWKHVEIRNDEQGWKLFSGDQCLADFGNAEEDARAALEVVQHYRFTEQVRVGDGPSQFAFYLSRGQAPRGLLLGVKTVSFRPDSLAVQRTHGTWMICAADQPVLDGGDSFEEATRVLQAIQRFRFDTMCQVGDEGKGMRFLVRDR